MKVTDSAKLELVRVLDSHNLQLDKCLRLAIPPTWDGPGDFGIVISVEGRDDHKIEYDGVNLLFLDSALADSLSNSVLDFKQTPEGSKFTLDVF